MNLPDGYTVSGIGTPASQTGKETDRFKVAAITNQNNTAINVVQATYNETIYNFTFKGWSTSREYTTSGLYQPNAEITIGANTTLYAIWDSTAVTGNLTVKKNVVDSDNLLSDNLSYQFTVDFSDNQSHSYKIRNANGVATGTTGTIEDGGTIELTGTKAAMNQVIIDGIATGSTVNVTENSYNGYTTSWAGGDSSNGSSTSVTIAGGSTKTITCTNSYKPVGTANIEVSKVLTGRAWQSGETFTFALLDQDGNKLQDVKVSEADKVADFATINYTGADEGKTFTYTIRETSELPAGVSKSGDVTATVAVTHDSANGELDTSVTYTNGGTITNTYTTTPVNTQFTVVKAINDTSESAQDATFTFQLKDSTGEVIQTKEITTENLTGSVSFDEITYSEANTYNYTIVEVQGDEAGYSYETKEYPVVVTVTDDVTTARLSASVTIDGTETTSLTVTNTYDPTDATAVLQARKVIDDQSDSAPDEIFTFQLLDSEENEIDTAEVRNGGYIDFEELTFDKTGTYTYIIKEVAGNTKGYTYDANECMVTVVVSDNGDGILSREISYEGGEAVFTNVYKAEETGLTLDVTKKLTGVTEGMTAATFQFTLTDEAGKLLQTKSVQGAGEVAFDAITYDKAGTYQYTVAEINDGVTGYTYDSTKYFVTVTVKDSAGALEAIASIWKIADNNEMIEVDEITFTNTYTAPVTKDPSTTPITKDPSTTPITKDPSVPETGDKSNLGLNITLMLLSFAAIAGILFRRRVMR